MLSFCRSPLSLSVLLPSMFTPAARASSTKYRVEGCTQLLGLDPVTTRTNFRQLGELAKHMTCLLPTVERVEVSCELVSRLSCPQGGSGPLMAALGHFLHTLLRGWADDECSVAATVIFRLFDYCVAVTGLLGPDYRLGSRLEQEMLVRSFLYSVFHREVMGRDGEEVRQQQRLWLRSLLLAASPERQSGEVGRVLLLLSSPAREDVWQYGVQWLDHVSIVLHLPHSAPQEEAIPANLSVASGRYRLLVSLLHSLSHMSPAPVQLSQVLASMFQSPGPWLPENVGSVLLLLGQNITREYLHYSAAQPTHACTNCFKPLSTAFIGLAVMTARFRRGFTSLFHRLDEVLEQVSWDVGLRRSLLTALWEGLAGEVRDLRQSVGEDWVQEGAMHLCRVVRAVGERMMEKAYLGPRLVSEE